MRLPESCDGCLYNGTEYPVGSKIQEGSCEECKCVENEEGESAMECYPSCNIKEYDCSYVSFN